MNEELEALREIKSISERITFNEKHKLGKVDYQWIKEIICKNTEIIKKSLKVQEKYVQIAEKEHEEFMYAQKKLRALEIIKEKQVDISTLLEAFNPSKMTLKAILKACESFNGLDFYNANYYQYDNKARGLTQEEYDLLKEVLL